MGYSLTGDMGNGIRSLTRFPDSLVGESRHANGWERGSRIKIFGTTTVSLRAHCLADAGSSVERYVTRRRYRHP